MRFLCRCLSQRVEICLEIKQHTYCRPLGGRRAPQRAEILALPFRWIDWNRPKTRRWHCLCRDWHPHSAVFMMSNKLIECSRDSHWNAHHAELLWDLKKWRHLVRHMCCCTKYAWAISPSISSCLWKIHFMKVQRFETLQPAGATACQWRTALG